MSCDDLLCLGRVRGRVTRKDLRCLIELTKRGFGVIGRSYAIMTRLIVPFYYSSIIIIVLLLIIIYPVFFFAFSFLFSLFYYFFLPY
jgi:hypothetical protein